jgi:4-amino-4-deoxy-L-arabinose transferase-like glycosyltransferase
MEIFSYLAEYFKINAFALWFVLFLVALASLKYCRKFIPFKLSTRSWLLVILALGLALRLLWLGFSSHEPLMTRDAGRPTENDLINIHAIELTQGIWFEDANGEPYGRRPIGYPMFLGLLYKIFGVHVEVVWMAQLTLFLLSAYFIFLIAKETFSEQVGLFATFLYVTYPTSIYAIKLITDEHLLLPLWYGGIYLLVREMKGRHVHHNWLWYGLIFGYATMVRTHIIFMPVVVGLAEIFKKSPIRRAVLTCLFVGVVMQLMNLPWVIRNYQAWGVPVLYTPTSAYIYAQVNDSAKPWGGGHVPLRGEPGFSEDMERAIVSGNPGLLHREANRQMVKWIRQNPGRFLVLGTARVLDFMCWNRKGGVWPIWFQFEEGHYSNNTLYLVQNKKTFEELAFLAYYSVFFASLFGVLMFLFNWRVLPPPTRGSLILIGTMFLFWFLEHMVIYPDRKYRYPLEPLMMIFGSYFLYYVYERFRWKKILMKGSQARKNDNTFNRKSKQLPH